MISSKESSELSAGNFVTIWDSIPREEMVLMPHFNKMAITNGNRQWWIIPVNLDILYTTKMVRIYKSPRPLVEYAELHASGSMTFSMFPTNQLQSGSIKKDVGRCCLEAADVYKDSIMELSSCMSLEADDESMYVISFGPLGMKKLIDLWHGEEEEES